MQLLICLKNVLNGFLFQRKSLSRSEKYPHIINVEAAKAAATGEEMSLEAQVNRCKTITMEG